MTVDTVLPSGVANGQVASGIDSRSAAAIVINDLKVTAGKFTLHAEKLSIPSGSRVAVVGANGSGKTTLIESVLGVKRADQIEGSLLGVEIRTWHRGVRYHRELGVQLQRGLYPSHLTPAELIKLHKAAFRSADAKIADALQIAQIGNVPFRGLSPGQRQRLMLYLALSHRPRLLVVDEPLSALDRMFTNVVVELLREYRGTLVMVCHTATELDLVDQLLWIESGKIKRHLSLDSAIAEARSVSESNAKSRREEGTDALRMPDAEPNRALDTISDEARRPESSGARLSLLNQILRVCTRATTHE